MIRDRLKGVVRKVALKALGMEWDAEELAPNASNSKVDKVVAFDPSVIPKVVDGSGDTPGPKHATEIGRTWLASQVASGVSPFIIDIRPPKECVAGMLPGAMLLPGEQVKLRLDVLPKKDIRVTVYDQLGRDESAAIAAYLREQGWVLARQLRGGYAEWLEHDEPMMRPEAPAGGTHHIGQPVEARTGKRGFIQAAWSADGVAKYTVLYDDGVVSAPLGEDELVP